MQGSRGTLAVATLVATGLTATLFRERAASLELAVPSLAPAVAVRASETIVDLRESPSVREAAAASVVGESTSLAAGPLALRAIGYVVSNEGVPLPGVDVTLWRSGARYADDPPLARVLTDERGEFDLPVLEPFARFRCFAAKSGYCAELAHGEGGRRLRVALGRGVFVRGRVLEADGRRPSREVRVEHGSLVWSDEDQAPVPLSARVDAEGRYELGPLPASSEVRLSMVLPQSLPLDRDVRTGPEDAEGFDLYLSDSHRLELLLHEERSGEPVGDVEVDVREYKDRRSFQAHTDSEGRLEVWLPERESQLGLTIAPLGWCRTSIAVPLDPMPTSLRVPCAPGCTIFGRVSDEDGRPIAGARVLVLMPWRPRGALAKPVIEGSLDYADVTNEQGEFQLSGRFGESASIRATQDGRVTARATWSLGDDELEIVLPRGGRIRGTVTWAGEPGLAYVFCRKQGSKFGRGGQSAADGSFEVTGLEDGIYDVTVRRTRYVGRSFPASEPVDVVGSGISPCDVEVPLRVLPIRGQVYRGRDPLGGVAVEAKSDRGRTTGFTDPSGHFELETLEDEVCRIRCEDRVQIAGVAAGTEGLRIDITPTAALQVRVLDTVTGRFVERPTVVFFPRGRPSLAGFRWVLANPAGIAEPRLPEGVYDLLVHADGRAPRHVRNVTVPAPGVIEIELQSSRTVAFRRVDEHGQLAPHVDVACIPAAFYGTLPVEGRQQELAGLIERTFGGFWAGWDRDGLSRVRGLREGPHVLVARDSRTEEWLEEWTQRFELKEDSAAEVEVGPRR